MTRKAWQSAVALIIGCVLFIKSEFVAGALWFILAEYISQGIQRGRR